jgi:acetylornithine/succinyldiaminopimelate/putrescine aminotransferase
MGLLLNAVTEKTLRLAPALIVNFEQVKRCSEIIDDAIKSVKKSGNKS